MIFLDCLSLCVGTVDKKVIIQKTLSLGGRISGSSFLSEFIYQSQSSLLHPPYPYPSISPYIMACHTTLWWHVIQLREFLPLLDDHIFIFTYYAPSSTYISCYFLPLLSSHPLIISMQYSKPVIVASRPSDWVCLTDSLIDTVLSALILISGDTLMPGYPNLDNPYLDYKFCHLCLFPDGYPPPLLLRTFHPFYNSSTTYKLVYKDVWLTLGLYRSCLVLCYSLTFWVYHAGWVKLIPTTASKRDVHGNCSQRNCTFPINTTSGL